MSKSSIYILIPILVTVTLACDSGPAKPATPTDTKPTASADADPAAPVTPPPVVEDAAAPMDYSGTYDNSGGAKLTIANFVSEKGFDFHLVIKTEDDCNGVDYSGAVTFNEPNKATNDQSDMFKLEQGRVRFEPSTEMIGMECARLLEVEFAKQK